MYSSAFDVRMALTPGADNSDKATAAGFEDEQLEDAIHQADSIIDMYTGRYTMATELVVSQGLQIEVARSPVRWWSRDIAAYLATLTYKRNKDVSADDPVRLRYNMAMSALTSIRSGEADLPSTFELVDGISDVTVHNQYQGRLFGPDDFDLSYRWPTRHSFHIWPGGT